MRDIPYVVSWLACCAWQAYSAAALAGRSSKKRTSPNQITNGGGFGRPCSQPQPPYLPDTSASTQKLISWLHDQECEGVGPACGTEVGYHPTSQRRGMFATKDFKPGDFVLGMPFPACLTLAREDLMDETADVELGYRLLGLMRQQGGGEATTASFVSPKINNKWRAYFETLPTRDGSHFDATPDFFSDDEIAALECPPLIRKVLKRKQDLEQYAIDNSSMDLADLQFATWMVKSRGFTLLQPVPPSGGDDESKTTANASSCGNILSKTVLMPFVDMINYSGAHANVELLVLETKAEDESMYALQALRPIPNGKEITLSYGTGQESSAELLFQYGFVPDNNPNDVSFFQNELPQDISWSSNLAQDEEELRDLVNTTSRHTTNEKKQREIATRRKILKLRIHLKRTQQQRDKKAAP